MKNSTKFIFTLILLTGIFTINRLKLIYDKNLAEFNYKTTQSLSQEVLMSSYDEFERKDQEPQRTIRLKNLNLVLPVTKNSKFYRPDLKLLAKTIKIKDQECIYQLILPNDNTILYEVKLSILNEIKHPICLRK